MCTCRGDYDRRGRGGGYDRYEDRRDGGFGSGRRTRQDSGGPREEFREPSPGTQLFPEMFAHIHVEIIVTKLRIVSYETTSDDIS